MDKYKWDQVRDGMCGLWQAGLTAITGMDDNVFSGKHQACPVCGGKDRFRFTDSIHDRGDGGAICNQCGAGDGMHWLMKITGLNFSDSVNKLGRFINAMPINQQEIIKKENFAVSNKKSSYSSSTTDGEVRKLMAECTSVEKTHLTGICKINPDKINIITNAEHETVICVTIGNIVNFPAQGQDPKIINCNVAMIDECEFTEYLAGKLTYGAVSVIGKNTGKSIYLCDNWVDSWVTHAATGAQVWCCWNSRSLVETAFKFRSQCRSGQLVAAVNMEFHQLCDAEEGYLSVIVPDGHDRIRIARKFIKKRFDPANLINEMQKHDQI